MVLPYPSIKYLNPKVKKALKTRKERYVFVKAFNAHAAEHEGEPEYKEGESFMAGYKAARAHRESLQPKLSEVIVLGEYIMAYGFKALDMMNSEDRQRLANSQARRQHIINQKIDPVREAAKYTNTPFSGLYNDTHTGKQEALRVNLQNKFRTGIDDERNEYIKQQLPNATSGEHREQIKANTPRSNMPYEKAYGGDSLGSRLKADVTNIGRSAMNRIPSKYHAATGVGLGLLAAGGVGYGIHKGYKAIKGFKDKQIADKQKQADADLKAKYDTITKEQNRKKMQAVVSGQDNVGDKLSERYRFSARNLPNSQPLELKPTDAITYKGKDPIKANKLDRIRKQLKLTGIDEAIILRSELKREGLQNAYK